MATAICGHLDQNARRRNANAKIQQPHGAMFDNRVLALETFPLLHHTQVTYLDVLLGVFQVLEQSVITPGDTGLLVGSRVRITVGLSRLTAKEPIKVGSLLVCTSLFNSVALTALGLENLSSL